MEGSNLQNELSRLASGVLGDITSLMEINYIRPWHTIIYILYITRIALIIDHKPI